MYKVQANIQPTQLLSSSASSSSLNCSSKSANEILKVQRHPNKIIISELLVTTSNNKEEDRLNDIISKQDLPSNDAVVTQEIYKYDPCSRINQVPSTFQPLKSSSSTKQTNSLRIQNSELIKEKGLDSYNGKGDKNSTHYIIQPDPNFDTKIIDGLLKQKKLSDFDENKF